MILPCWRGGGKFPVAGISAHGGGEGERSRSDCEITSCVVKVGSYFLTLPEKKWTLSPFTTAPNEQLPNREPAKRTA